MKDKLIIKFNNGNPVALCSSCHKIIKYWSEFTDDQKAFALWDGNAESNWLSPIYCDNCIGENADNLSLSVK